MKVAALSIMLAILACGSAQAEKVYAGSRGGFSCEDQNDVIVTAAGRLKAADFPLGKSCSAIEPYTTIDAIKSDALNDETTFGVGTIKGGDKIIFVVYRDVIPVTSHGRTFKRVSPVDVRNTPSKWKGRDIEFASVNVYWVADDDVRLLTTALTVFATKVRGSAVEFLRKECETQAEAVSSKCRVMARIKYAEHDEDKPDGFSSRTILKTADVELIRNAARR